MLEAFLRRKARALAFLDLIPFLFLLAAIAFPPLSPAAEKSSSGAQGVQSRNWRGFVIDVREGNEIWINAGAKHGVRAGHKFEALGVKKVRDPSGKVHKLPGGRKAVIEIVERP